MPLSEFQKRKIALAFYKFDTSKDGIVEAADLELVGRKVAEIQGVHHSSPDYEKILSAHKAVWHGYFQPHDDDGDNKVTVDEYIQACESFIDSANLSDSAMDLNRAVFDSLDLDGSGKIDSIEFAVYLRAIGISEQDAKTAFEKLDADRNGYICRDEFAKSAFEYFTSNDPNAPGNWFYGSY